MPVTEIDFLFLYQRNWELQGNLSGLFTFSMPSPEYNICDNMTAKDGTFHCKELEVPPCVPRKVSCQRLDLDTATYNIKKLGEEEAQASPCTWTAWLNSNVANGGNDDETLENLVARFGQRACMDPTDLEVRMVRGKKPLSQSKNVIAFNNIEQGFSCKALDNNLTGTCDDFEVKLCCSGNALFTKLQGYTPLYKRLLGPLIETLLATSVEANFLFPGFQSRTSRMGKLRTILDSWLTTDLK